MKTWSEKWAECNKLEDQELFLFLAVSKVLDVYNAPYEVRQQKIWDALEELEKSIEAYQTARESF